MNTTHGEERQLGVLWSDERVTLFFLGQESS